MGETRTQHLPWTHTSLENMRHLSWSQDPSSSILHQLTSLKDHHLKDRILPLNIDLRFRWNFSDLKVHRHKTIVHKLIHMLNPSLKDTLQVTLISSRRTRPAQWDNSQGIRYHIERLFLKVFSNRSVKMYKHWTTVNEAIMMQTLTCHHRRMSFQLNWMCPTLRLPKLS